MPIVHEQACARQHVRVDEPLVSAVEVLEELNPLLCHALLLLHRLVDVHHLQRGETILLLRYLELRLEIVDAFSLVLEAFGHAHIAQALERRAHGHLA